MCVWLISLLLWKWRAGAQELLVGRAHGLFSIRGSWLSRKARLCEWQSCGDLGCTCSRGSCPWCCWGWPGHSNKNGGPYVGGGKFSVAGSPLPDHHYTFAIGRGLQATVLRWIRRLWRKELRAFRWLGCMSACSSGSRHWSRSGRPSVQVGGRGGGPSHYGSRRREERERDFLLRYHNNMFPTCASPRAGFLKQMFWALCSLVNS